MMKKNYRFLFLAIVSSSLYVCAVVAYASWVNQERMHSGLAEIDNRLRVVAGSLKYMLAPDFHDRALDERSISFAEEMKNRKMLSGFAEEAGFKWIYTLVEKNGKFYFSAPTVSEEEAKERRSWYFYPYDDIPPEFVKALRENKAVYVNYQDQWGSFRSVAVPETSPGGRRYLSCADYEISKLKAFERANINESVLTAVFFLLCSLPFTLVSWWYFRMSTLQLKTVNAELSIHKENLEELVAQRTLSLENANTLLNKELRERELIEQALKEEKGKLEEALSRVKVLSGLLPICSSCKKIRDDKGYWNQIEGYIREHSDAEFSHSICPECLKKLYPDIDFKE